MTELNEQNSKLGELKNKVLLFSMILQKKNWLMKLKKWNLDVIMKIKI